MADITITIPDQHIPRVVAAFAAEYGWTAEDGPKGAFAKAALIRHVRQVTRRYEAQAAAQAAMLGVSDVDAT